MVCEHLDDNGNDGLRGHCLAFPLLIFTLTPPIKVLDIQNVIRNSGGSLKLSSKFIPSLKTCVVWPSDLQLAATVGTSFQHHSGDPQEVDGFIRVIKATEPHVFAIDRIAGPAYLLPESRTNTGGGSIWIINSQVDFDTYWDVY